MKTSPVFIVAFFILLVLGVTGLWMLTGTNKTSTSQTGAPAAAKNTTQTKPNRLASATDGANENGLGDRGAQQRILQTGDTNRSNNTDLFTLIRNSISERDFAVAAADIGRHYSALSAGDLDQLLELYLSEAYQLSSSDHANRFQALRAISLLYDDPRVWRGMAQAAIGLKDWGAAVDAQLSLLQLQSDAADISQTHRELLLTSNQLRAELEAQGDDLSIKDLYQRINRFAPNASRFQLELAYAHARVDETADARALLELLIYDVDVGTAAQSALDLLDKQTAAVEPVKRPEPEPINGIVIPLETAGTSFLVNTQIERRGARLLLDTGASITALSRTLVNQLNLEPLNRQIRLNTANGSTTANLYRVKKLRLGQLELRDLVIADIDLGNASQFQGLLGTDALNQLKQTHDYLIDDRRKALIFRRR